MLERTIELIAAEKLDTSKLHAEIEASHPALNFSFGTTRNGDNTISVVMRSDTEADLDKLASRLASHSPAKDEREPRTRTEREDEAYDEMLTSVQFKRLIARLNAMQAEIDVLKAR